LEKASKTQITDGQGAVRGHLGEIGDRAEAQYGSTAATLHGMYVVMQLNSETV
jgi:hypothetical protein